jgi:hypothetical protein
VAIEREACCGELRAVAVEQRVRNAASQTSGPNRFQRLDEGQVLVGNDSSDVVLFNDIDSQFGANERQRFSVAHATCSHRR